MTAPKRHRPVKVDELVPGDAIKFPGSGLHWVEAVRPIDEFISIDLSANMNLDSEDVVMILNVRHRPNEVGDDDGEVAY